MCWHGGSTKTKWKGEDLCRLNANVTCFTLARHTTLAQLGSANFFTKLDANSGFWHIEMDPQLSEFTTIVMPFWRHKFNRLPKLLQPLNISKEILGGSMSHRWCTCLWLNLVRK